MSLFFAPRLPKSTTANAPTSETPLVIKESVAFRGALKQKTNVSHWVHRHYKVYRKQPRTANCNHCKLDYVWKSSTSTLVSHLRAKHRDIYDAEEKKEAAYKVGEEERQYTKLQKLQHSLYAYSKADREMPVIRYIVTTGCAKRTFITHYLLRVTITLLTLY